MELEELPRDPHFSKFVLFIDTCRSIFVKARSESKVPESEFDEQAKERNIDVDSFLRTILRSVCANHERESRSRTVERGKVGVVHEDDAYVSKSIGRLELHEWVQQLQGIV